jgi:hypothetical protein
MRRIAAPIPEDARDEFDHKPHYWVNEDQLIQFDHERFSDWLAQMAGMLVGATIVISAGSQRISVY